MAASNRSWGELKELMLKTLNRQRELVSNRKYEQ